MKVLINKALHNSIKIKNFQFVEVQIKSEIKVPQNCIQVK